VGVQLDLDEQRRVDERGDDHEGRGGSDVAEELAVHGHDRARGGCVVDVHPSPHNIGPAETDCILATHADSPSVDVTTGKIQGVPGQDPAAVFLIATPANQRDVEIDGWELAVQHLFGESGFGMSANYTMVDADIGYDDGSLDDQFAILGLSDSANVVGFYDKNGWIVRLAWNWRDEFLSGTVDGNGIPNPVYTEEYAQLDAIVSYTFGNGMTVFAEGFNLTDEYLRLHSRTEEQIEFVTQLGPRYGVGFRWVY
jgi:TonB-dependent receptor